MTQELIQEKINEKPSYAEWMRSLKTKVETSEQEEQEEYRWKLRYGKT